MGCLDDATVLRFVSGRLDELARRRVTEELGRCGRCAGLVAALLRERTPGDPTEPDAGAPAASEPDDDSPRYAVGAVIARGGMGTILAAFDRRLAREVAIKRLDSDREGLAIRFAREIQVTATLQHPGIVSIYDSGRLPDGRPFYAMRRVEGESLDDAIARRRTDRERMELLAPVLAAAEAVAYAHERGVIHRDLKPSNILVGRFGETVVIDWGLARAGDRDSHTAGAGCDGDAAMTLDGALVGTPRYMAPEQARGEPATRASDVYALGVILYRAMSGSPPVAASELGRVIDQVARAEVAPLAQLVPRLPAELVAIVERAMAPRPEARYADAGALAADLRRFQTGQLVAAYSYSRGDLVRRFVRRHRAVLALAALSTLVIACGGALALRGILDERGRAEHQQRVAERERTGAEDLVRFLVHDLTGKLQSVGRLDVLTDVPDRVDAYYLTTADRPELVAERASLEVLRADLDDHAGDGAAAERHLAHGTALIARAPATPRTDEVRASLLATAATRAGRQGEWARAEPLLGEAIALLRGLSPGDAGTRRRVDLALVGQLKDRGKVVERLGRAAEAERDWIEAIAIVERARAGAPDDRELAERLGALQLARGQNLSRRGEHARAQGPLEEALVVTERLTAREPRNARFQNLHAWACLSLADLEGYAGRFERADQLRIRARDVARDMAAVEPASGYWQEAIGRAELNLGDSAVARERWADAAEHFRAARSAHERLAARDPSNQYNRRQTAVSIAQLALAESRLGHADAARAAHQEALAQLAELARSNTPKARLEWANGLQSYAAFERTAGRTAAAGEAIAAALALVEGTPAMVEKPADAYYRAAVWLEAGRARAGEPRGRWTRAAALLRALAAQGPLEADAAALLRELDAELSRHG